VVASLLMAGCSDIQNPSGSCGTREGGGRPGYHSPGGSTWVPDCQNELLREYWRVFSDEGTSAYMIPRPDGAAEIQPVCADASHELRPLVDRYGLCVAAGGIDQVNPFASVISCTHSSGS
jgi:hypothetical protein